MFVMVKQTGHYFLERYSARERTEKIVKKESINFFFQNYLTAYQEIYKNL